MNPHIYNAGLLSKFYERSVLDQITSEWVIKGHCSHCDDYIGEDAYEMLPDGENASNRLLRLFMNEQPDDCDGRLCAACACDARFSWYDA